MSEHTAWYFVSADPDQLIWPEFNRDHMTSDHIDQPHYRTQQDALDAIKAGEHGAFGPLYVIKADFEVVATATRGWELIKGERP